jgi:hypothetical protein
MPATRTIWPAAPTHTFEVDPRRIGEVLTRRGTLLAARYVKGCDKRLREAVFELRNGAGRPLMRADVISQMYPVASANGLYDGTILRGAIEYEELVLAQCPHGAQFSLEIKPGWMR